MRSIPECILELELLWEKGVSLARRRAALRGFARAQRLVDKVTGRTWK
jgi:hypothetical protein